jgi:hypothetical protein
MSHPKHIKQKFIELRAAGLSYDKISADMRISKTTLLKWAVEFEKEIAAIEYVNAEELVNKYRLFRQARFEDAVVELDRIRAAIKSKVLSDVNMTALLDLEARRKDEVSTMFADLQKNAGLNNDGQKQAVTPAMIAEINKALGMDI